jgi:hypothetical protein
MSKSQERIQQEIAKDRSDFANRLRRQRFANLQLHTKEGMSPASAEFVAGAEWALRAIASWCDKRAAEARGEQP